METILQNFSPQALIQAIEANLFGLYCQVRHWPRVDLHDDPELLWTISDIPYFLFNSSLRADLPPQEVEPAIRAAIQRGQHHQVPIGWLIGPTTRPADLGERLLAHGFTLADSEPGMAVDCKQVNGSLPAAHGLSIEWVKDAQTLKTWSLTKGAGFDQPNFVSEAFYDFYLNLGFETSSPVQLYLGWLDGLPVATSKLFLGAGVAGIYDVSTIPAARRQGIGAAMTLRPLLDARSRGYQVGILQASEMGANIYRQLGFQEYCRINVYVRNPA
jgi:ribosomal protein S18 acetylase RimI-like enzyme